jgi:UDP-N-acetylglucosamine 1-carboxyvinyltransferase
MAKYIIEGGVPLKGTVKIPGAKNAGFKLMIASLLSDDPSTLSNVPIIRDVVSVSKIIEVLGAKVEISGDKVQISGGIKNWEVPEELGLKSRASFMYLPILLHRFEKGKVPLPVGDKIGNRPINWFCEGLEKMGCTINKQGDSLEVATKSGLVGADYKFPKNSHTGTEGLIMAAVLATGKTKLENTAAEPEVDDLISLLNKMGAKIKRVDERAIEIEGVNTLYGAVHEIMPDRNEVVTFGCMALGTKGKIEIENVNDSHVTVFISKVKSAGGGLEKGSNRLKVFYEEELVPTFVQTGPHPSFMTDWQSQWVALMTQASGVSVIYETIFENRFGYVRTLQKMGARIELFETMVENPRQFYNFDWTKEAAELPHAANIFGPTKLKGGKLEVADIRSGATMVFAALMAKGESEIFGIEHIERGYEDLEGRLQKLGAKIKKVG